MTTTLGIQQRIQFFMKGGVWGLVCGKVTLRLVSLQSAVPYPEANTLTYLVI